MLRFQYIMSLLVQDCLSKTLQAAEALVAVHQRMQLVSGWLFCTAS
jgi:hypothetical protein